ncbi:MAG: ComEC/Rec2 family competence protein [Desulfitobacteriaceae bacterium]|nr:ComEC/Rec2 family competence protein [Desulfitobacteriaceae bacterium]
MQQLKKFITLLVVLLTIVIFAEYSGGSLMSPAPDQDTPTSAAPQSEDNTGESDLLKVHFIDVGQADSTLVELPNGQIMLIDAGNNGDGDFLVGYLKEAGVKQIDYLVGTHPHEDHIGGLDTMIYNFKVGKVIMPDKSHTSETFKDVLSAIKSKKIPLVKASAGKTLITTPNLEAMILAPVKDDYDEINDYSAVIKITYQETDFLFQGDAGFPSENDILAQGFNLKTDVIKVGHHGSYTSSSANYLAKVKPSYAVISVGKENSYGHPHDKALARLNKTGAKIYRTDLDGTLIFTSNGDSINVTHSDQGNPD